MDFGSATVGAQRFSVRSTPQELARLQKRVSEHLEAMGMQAPDESEEREAGGAIRESRWPSGGRKK